MCISQSYRLLRTSILGIKKLHKSEVEGGNRRPGFLLKLPPRPFEARVGFAGFGCLHSPTHFTRHWRSADSAICIEAAVAMEAVWAGLADSEVEAGRGEEQLLTTVTSSVAAVALLAEA